MRGQGAGGHDAPLAGITAGSRVRDQPRGALEGPHELGLQLRVGEAELAQLEQLVEKLSAEESDRIWDQLHDSVDMPADGCLKSVRSSDASLTLQQ